MTDLIERLKDEAGGYGDGPTVFTNDDIAALRSLLNEAAAALEAARGDAARLAWLAIDGCVEGFVGVEYDIYDYACGVAEESGREEPNGSDMLAGLRRLVDAAIDAAQEARNG